MRALLLAFDYWVRDGIEPPESRVPRIDDGTLVQADQQSTGFPSIPGVNYYGLYNASGGRDFGPRVQGNRGVIDYLRPHVLRPYQVLVPKVDNIGNDIAGIRHPYVEAPTATLTGWNPRRPEFTEGDLCETSGMWIPLSKTRMDAQRTGDPRPSLEELYGDHTGYVRAVAGSALSLWSQRLFLFDDVLQIIQAAEDSDVLR
jgi:hypothetical protein